MSALPDNRMWLKDIPPKGKRMRQRPIPGPYNLFARTKEEKEKSEAQAKRSLTKEKYIKDAIDKYEECRKKQKVNFKWLKKRK